MVTHRRFFLSLALSLVATSAPLTAQQLKTFNGWLTDVTPDGAIAVGYSGSSGVIWRWQTEPAPVPLPGGTCTAVSDDGTVIAGNMTVSGTQHAARWTAATGWVSLGGFDICSGSLSSVYDISGDGKQIVGLAWIGCASRAFRWTEGVGMELLDNLALGSNRASTISEDGSVIGGFANNGLIQNRTPAEWAADKTGVVWGGGLVGEINGMNNDGSVLLGTAHTTLPTRAFYESAGTGVLDLGSLQFNWKSSAMAISESGGTMVGFDVQGLSRKAWIRQSPSHTLVALQDHLLDLGIPAVPHIDVALACSDSGRTIVGGSLGVGGYVASQSAEAWTRLTVGGLAGSNGTPVLYGLGTLQAGSTATVKLTHGKPFGAATIVVGLSALNAPFKGGVLVPSATILVSGLPLDADGRFSAGFAWPAGVPSGTSLWYQAWIADGAGPKGFSASNGLQSTAP